MQITVTGRHISVSPALREYCINKLTKHIAHHGDVIKSTDVTMSVDREVQKVEALVHAAGEDIFAGSEAFDMYDAINSLTDKIDRQINRRKDKLRSHR